MNALLFFAAAGGKSNEMELVYVWGQARPEAKIIIVVLGIISVIAWSVSNETDENRPEVIEGNAFLVQWAKTLDPTRLATHVSSHWTKDPHFEDDDLISLNAYPTWGAYGASKAALERFSTGLASEVYENGIAVNVVSPGLVATPGVAVHGLINERTRDRVQPIEFIAEAVYRLASGDPKTMTGRIDYAEPFLKEIEIAPSELA